MGTKWFTPHVPDGCPPRSPLQCQRLAVFPSIVVVRSGVTRQSRLTFPKDRRTPSLIENLSRRQNHSI